MRKDYISPSHCETRRQMLISSLSLTSAIPFELAKMFHINKKITEKGSSQFDKWPAWAKAFSLVGICLIAFFFFDIPVQRSYSKENFLYNEHWQLAEIGIYWNITLKSGDRLLIDLEVLGDLNVIFYIYSYKLDQRMLEDTTSFSKNWNVPFSGKYCISIDNPYIVKRPKGYISVIHVLAEPQHRVEYPYRWLQWVLLAVGIGLVTTGFSAHPKLRPRNSSFKS